MEESLRLVRETIGNDAEEDSILHELCLKDAEQRDQIRTKLSYLSEAPEKRSSHHVLSSSALSISSLRNSPLHQNKQQEQDRDQLLNTKKIAVATCKDIERELEAVENRIAFYRQARQEQEEAVQEAHVFYQSKGDTRQTQEDPPVEDQETFPRQNAGGQVADEVENSLLKCELLLSKATAASSLRQKNFSSSASSSSASSSRSMKKFSPSVRIQPMNTALSPEEMALETKAQAMQSLLMTCQQEMEQEASDLYTRKKAIQSKQCQELRKKFASKKKMMLAALKETLDTENKRFFQMQQIQLDKELTNELTLYKEEMLKKRQEQMTLLLIEHSKKHESTIKQVEKKLQQESQLHMDIVTRDCQLNLDKELNQLEIKYKTSLDEWEKEMKQQFETNLKQQQEQKTMELLQTQEDKRRLFEKEIVSIKTKEQQEEIQKLEKALEMGLEMHLQTFRQKMETNHLKQKETLEAKANQALEIETQELETMLHKQFIGEMKQFETQLKNERHYKVEQIITKYQDLETKQRLEIKQQFITQLETFLKEESLNLQKQKNKKIKQYQEQQEEEFRQKIQLFFFEQEQILSKEMSIKKNEFRNRYLETLETKHHHFLQAISILQHQAKEVLRNIQAKAIDTTKRISNSSCDKLRSMGKEFLPREFLKYLELVVEEMDELQEEQVILIERITHVTQMCVQTKQKMIQLEEENGFFKEKMQEMKQTMQDKEQICMKLYQANEILLQKIQQEQQEEQEKQEQEKQEQELQEQVDVERD